MTLYPDVYEKARRSIDQVVGADRLVAIADREALPYITCVLKEVLRWAAICNSFEDFWLNCLPEGGVFLHR